MSKEKQIEEMSVDLAMCHTEFATGVGEIYTDYDATVQKMFAKGYRKQIVGGWKFHKDGSGTCSECHVTQRNVWDYDNWQNFCGHCGAKMKGGE